MQELEIKCQVPPDRLAAVEAELRRGAAAVQRIHLQAAYFDTADRRLAGSMTALRVRREGRRSVQTLKTSLDGMLTRFEHNVPLAAREGLAADPARHLGTPGGERLAGLLADGAALQEMYRTDVWRLTRRLRTRHGTVELALDVGYLVCGGARLAVRELEIELVQGRAQAVLDVARRWMARHGLWLDVRSKAEAGDRLSRGVASVPAVRGRDPQLDVELRPAQAWPVLLQHLLRPILANQSELASPTHAQTLPEHRMDQVHQLRVALRRLRSALRLFEGWPGIDAPQGLGERLADVFTALGSARDRDVAAQLLAPALAPAGLPAIDWSCGVPTADPAEVLRRPQVQALWLELLAWAHAPAGPAASEGGRLQDLAARRIRRWHRAVTDQADGFMALDDEQRHTLRKRIKRLRYAVDFTGSLFPPGRVKRYLKHLARAQETFGQFNDLCMADALLQPMDQPGAWYARGWLAARREASLTACQQALCELAGAAPFWKG